MTEKKGWSRRFHGIGLKLDPQVVRVANDFVLDVYLQEQPENCMRLAKYICRTYRKQYGEELKISVRSLAIEIYGHYKMQKAAIAVRRTVGESRLTGWLIGHTAVIDCGSAEKDSNRIVWDVMDQISDAERKTAAVKQKIQEQIWKIQKN